MSSKRITQFIHKGKKTFAKSKERGFSLMEVLVAIAISVVTMTSSVVFASQLGIRAQNNLLEETAIQVQNVISEQLRLMELGFRNNKSEHDITKVGDISALPGTVFFKAGWERVCTTNSSNDYFALNLPDLGNVSGIPRDFDLSFSDGDRINGIAEESIPVEDEKFRSYTYYKIGDQFGAVNLPMYVSINKKATYSPSNYLRNPSQNSIDFEVIVYFQSADNPKRAFLSEPMTVTMVYRIVCPVAN